MLEREKSKQGFNRNFGTQPIFNGMKYHFKGGRPKKKSKSSVTNN